MRTLRPWLLVLLVAAAGACTDPVDLTTGLEVVDLSSGWHDAGIVAGGQNKLVPSVTFRLKNLSDQTLKVLQVNVLFRRVNVPNEEWGSGFLTVAGSEGLAPQATTEPIVIHSQNGYTGPEARAQMLQNSQFVDANVEIFAKYSSTQWQRLGQFPIERTLLAQ